MYVILNKDKIIVNININFSMFVLVHFLLEFMRTTGSGEHKGILIRAIGTGMGNSIEII